MRCNPINMLRTLVLAASMAVAAVGQAITFDVTIDTTGLKGTDAILAFDLIGVGSPVNTVVVNPVNSDGSQGSESTTGSVTGTAPGPWTMATTQFFNELLIPFSPLGTFLSFSFATTDNAPSSGTPDAFSFAILDSFGTLPLFATTDPTGADVLFAYDMDGNGVQGIRVYSAVDTAMEFSISVTPGTNIPEPDSLALLALGAVVASAVRRRRTH